MKKPSLSLTDQEELIRLRQENEQLRMEHEILKKGRRLLCERSRIKHGFIQAQQKTYPVTILCRVMGGSTRAYYAWCHAAAVGDQTQQDQALADKLRQIFTDNKHCFGSRRLSDRLKKQGFAAGRFKTRRIMRELNLKVRYPKRFKVTTDSHHNETLLPNRLERQFQVAKPNQVWTLQGWLYVAMVIDLYSRQVVGWAIDDHMRTSLCVKAIANGLLAQKATARSTAPLGSRQPVCESGISPTSGGNAYGAKHEPQRQLLGQFADRTIFSQFET